MKTFLATLKHSACLTLLVAGALTGGSVGAQTVADNLRLLGKSHEELAPLPGMQALRAPRRLPSGAIGSLRAAGVAFEGQRWEQTFFFTHDRLAQMDLVVTDAGAAAQTALMQSLRAELGPELAAFGAAPGALPDSASWVSGDADVMLFRSGRPERPTLRVVIRQRQLVNADEL